ncbi:hypothetical protein WG907_03785 [Sphingobium sp. AN558]|uniref:hypothetical protein n=1 Tax=Sphingobium sp. AN558 TaxID=3133442 RepID=UPI0030BDE3FC
MILSPISRTKLRERIGGLAFALVFNLLLLLALFTLAPHSESPPVEDRNPVTFEMAPAQKAEREKARSAKRADEREARSAAQPVVQPKPVQKQEDQPPSPFPFMTLDSKQMAAADIGKMAKSDAGAGGGASGNSGAVSGPGEGPGGVQLFNAEWYRRPTNAELSPFLPGNGPPRGWGMVACKTIDHYHVENCQILGESPLGSGLARAVRLAAWQFLVLPPRINGKPQVGSWVRIRIDYSQTVTRAGGGEGDSGADGGGDAGQ